MDDFLAFIKEILPKQNNCPLGSNRAFKKRFNIEDDDAKAFFLCRDCDKLFEEDVLLNNLSTLSSCNFCSGSNTDAFVVFKLEKQLEYLLENRKLSDQIVNFNTKLHSKDASNNLSIGKIHANIQMVDEINYISLMLNTDGAPITSLNSYSMWPVLATIAELEPGARESFSNMFCLGTFIIFSIFFINLTY